MNQTIQSLKNHTSIRKFNSVPITDDVIDDIIEASLRGASAGNMMLYSFIDIRSKETLKKLSVWCDNQPFIADSQFALLVVVDAYKWDKIYKLNQLDVTEAYDCPTVADLALGVQDAMIAAQNAVIAAESLGIGTCYIGDIMENKEIISEYFNLPRHTMPVTLIVFGNFDTKPQLRDRFPKESVVFKEKYKQLNDNEIEEMFRGRFEGDGSVTQFYKRKRASDFYTEMVRSIKAYALAFFTKE